MLITVFPAIFITIFGVVLNIGLLIGNVAAPGAADAAVVAEATESIITSFTNFYLMMFAQGLLTVITEWKNINCANVKKILYCFSFPIFFMTYLPISITALFKKVEWKSIQHGVATAAQADAINRQIQESAVVEK